MSDQPYLFDMREIQFVLFEHLKAEKLFELKAYSEFDRGDVELLLAEGFRFAQEVLAPANVAGDRQGCQFDSGKVRVPDVFRAPYRKQAEARWMTMCTPQQYGGQGIPFVFGAALGEAFVGSNCSLSMLGGLTRAASDLLIDYGNDEMQRLYLKPMIDGTWQGTMCLTEAHAGTAVGSVLSKAVLRDGRYYIKGQKIFISGGDHDLVENVVHILLARIEGDPPGTKGLSLFLIPKIRVNPDGTLGEPNDVHCVGIEHKLGIHGSPTCAMSFGENDSCIGFLIGEPQQGMEIMFHMMNSARIGVGLQGMALGSAAYHSALAYARTRLQGPDMKNFRDPAAPSVPITRHPDVKRMLATMKAYCESGRALLLHAAICLDYATHGEDTERAERLAGRVELLTPLCKAWCSDTGFESAVIALQTMGGHGYLKDYPVEQYLRDAKIASIYEGTNGIQALDLLGRKLGRKHGQLLMQLMEDIGNTVDEHRAHPTLGIYFERLGARKEKMQEIAMQFAMAQMSGDLDFPMLCATPFLRLMSNVVGAWLLLEQAVVANAALERLFVERKADSAERRQALCEEGGDPHFYDQKIKTARFFVSHILAENDAIASTIEAGDRAALEMQF